MFLRQYWGYLFNATKHTPGTYTARSHGRSFARSKAWEMWAGRTLLKIQLNYESIKGIRYRQSTKQGAQNWKQTREREERKKERKKESWTWARERERAWVVFSLAGKWQTSCSWVRTLSLLTSSQSSLLFRQPRVQNAIQARLLWPISSGSAGGLQIKEIWRCKLHETHHWNNLRLSEYQNTNYKEKNSRYQFLKIFSLSKKLYHCVTSSLNFK